MGAQATRPRQDLAQRHRGCHNFEGISSNFAGGLSSDAAPASFDSTAVGVAYFGEEIRAEIVENHHRGSIFGEEFWEEIA